MAVRKLSPVETVRQKTETKKNKNAHKAKSWATLDQNSKNAIIGDDLIARGIVSA